MSLKPVVVLDKEWYRKNRVRWGYVGSAKLAKRHMDKVKRMKKVRGKPIERVSVARIHALQRRMDEVQDKLYAKELERPRDVRQSPRQAAYAVFLASKFWQNLRLDVLEQRGHRCEACGTSEMLQVHHQVYPKNWYDTRSCDLKVLCRECHEWEHKISYRNGERWLEPAGRPRVDSPAARSCRASAGSRIKKHSQTGRDGQQSRPRDSEDGSTVDQPSPLQGLPA